MDEPGSLGLPPRDIFPDEMPRYPNVWLFVPLERALRREYHYALGIVDRLLHDELDLRDSFHDDVRNPGLRRLVDRPGEGADYQARIGPLAGTPAHAHQLHARFYVSPLLRAGRCAMRIDIDGESRDCFCVPASVHYEVATEEPTHPYVDDCPSCGLTGEYALDIDRSSQDYCLKVHDPLGVELLLYGTVRGSRELRADGKPVSSLAGLGAGAVYTEERRPGPYGCTRLALVLLREAPRR